MPDLAVIVPTRGRPENIRRVIGAWDFTNAWDHADLIVVADSDDPEIPAYRSIWMEDDSTPGRLVEVPTWLPMVHKLDAVARDLASEYFAVGFAGDDHLPQTINWAARYLTVLRELSTGMVYGDDGYQGAKLSTEWAVTSDAVRALGRMVPAPVEHMFCDNSIMELFTLARAIRHLPEVRIEHMHPVAGKAITDDQYQRVNSREQMGRDRRTYRRWQSHDMALQVATIRSLRRGQIEQRPARLPRTAKQQGRNTMKPPRFFKRVQAATPEDIMMALADFAAQVPADQEIVEIGVFHGRTALQLAWGARQGHGAHVTAIDPWDMVGNTYGPPFTDSGTRRWAYHHVKSLGFSRDIELIQAFSKDAVMNYDGPPIGLLFIDGDHSEEGARRDVVDWAPYLAPDARIAIDDYGHPDWPGVKLAVDKLVADAFLHPVEVFHGALAVTRISDSVPPRPTEDEFEGLPVLDIGEAASRLTAITSEGVHPSPEPPTSDEVLAMFDGLEEHFAPDSDDALSSPHPAYRNVTVEGEVEGVADGTSIDSLNIAQLKVLARHRGITLGVRKDKRSEILQALRDGR